MAGFAVVLGPEFDTWNAASLPPTYEAYQEMLAARQTGFDFAAAAEHYRRAAALDTSFTGAQTSRAVVLWLSGACVAVDSIARRLEPRKRLLPPTDRGQLDLASAGCREDTDAALDAVRTALDAAPRSAYFTILGAVIALEHLRPRESLEILRRLDPDKVGLEGHARELYSSWLQMTYHMLGDYGRELETAHGQSASALAALGRVEEAERMALGFLPERHSADDPWPGPMLTQCVALELRAHGHPEAARRVFERVVAWYGTGGINDATRDDFPCARPHFSAFYYTGRWAEARAGYQHRLAVDTTDPKAHAALGALAVRRGDRAEADRMDAWLAGRPEGRAAYSRARLAALGGDRERAVAMVRRAFELGLRYRMFLHLDPDFESLREYPPYRELIQPKE
jgi:tetratricopeptide (TPR) repeat protein